MQNNSIKLALINGTYFKSTAIREKGIKNTLLLATLFLDALALDNPLEYAQMVLKSEK